MIQELSARFKDAPWFEEKLVPVIVGGAGGIGTWLSLLLTRAGLTPYVYDFDLIEEHNIGGQLFSKKHIGKHKVDALAEIVKDFTGEDIATFNQRYELGSMTTDYVFSAFDNMQARKDMFENWKNHIQSGDSPNAIFIDGRLTAEQLQIFCVTPDRIKDYEEHLFDDSEVEDAPCTMKQTSHCAAMIASHMVGFFTNHLTNINMEDDERNIPFFYEYYIPIVYTQVT